MLKFFSVILVLTTFYHQTLSFECGQTKHSEGFVVNGSTAKRGAWPWLAALFNTNSQEFFCAATLVSSNHVVSAAHCIQPKHTTRSLKADDIAVLLGKYNLSQPIERGSIISYVQNIHVHPEWKTYTDQFDADIAILELKTSIEFSEFIQPICWPSRSGDIYEGSIVGWGRSESGSRREDIPREAQIGLVQNEACFLKYKELAAISSTRTFCAGGENVGPCNGDSGGGFFVKSNTRWIIRGIISSSLLINGECDINRYAIYTNVVQFSDWVNNIINQPAPSISTKRKPVSFGAQEVIINCHYFFDNFVHATPKKSRWVVGAFEDFLLAFLKDFLSF